MPSFCPSATHRRLRSGALALLLCLSPFLLRQDSELPEAWACSGDPPAPVCSKTLVISLGVPGTIKADTPISLDIPAYVFWSLIEVPPGSGVCPPPPYRAVIEVRLVCQGAADIVFTQVIENLPLGHNVIPVKIDVPAGPPRKCILDARITVRTSDGMVISRTSRQCLCIVDCSDKDPSLPRLEIRPVTAGSEVARTHPGDQTSHIYRICNNDKDASFHGILEVTSANDSRRPLDESPAPAPPGMGVFGLSDGRGDAFPIAFRESLAAQGCIVLPPEPQRIIEATAARPIILGPCEWIEVELVARPWGMCANGSCSKLTWLVEGIFADGTRGVGCAGAVVVADTTRPPRYAWPDSGKVTPIRPLPTRRLQMVGLPTPTSPPVPIEIELVQLSLSSVGRPIQVQQSLQVEPLFHPQVTPEPEKGRLHSFHQALQPGPNWAVDSFFDITYRIDFLGAPGSVARLESMGVIPGAPAGFETTAPLAMGVLASMPEGATMPSSFFDITYQISGQALAMGPTGQPEMFRMSFFDVFFEVTANGVMGHAMGLVDSRAVIGAGGGGGLPVAGPILGVEILHDFTGFARPRPLVPCPVAPSLTDLVCVSDGSSLCLVWQRATENCPCDRIEIRDPSGRPLAVLPGTASRFCIPCDQLPALSGTLCVVCVDAAGRETQLCCDYTCIRDPCPPVAVTSCEAVDGSLVVAWTPLPQGCCDRFVIRQEPDGAVLGTVPGTASSFSIGCAVLPAQAGTICVECVSAAGLVLHRACCDYQCLPTPCEPFDVACAFDGNVARMDWTAVRPECCERLEVFHRDDPGNLLATLPPTSRSFEIPCDEIVARTGKPSGELCIACVAPDGTRIIRCCPYDCESPCPPLEILRCEVLADGTFLLQWSPLPPECCSRFEIRDASGRVLLTLPAGESRLQIPCDELAALTGQRAGQICLVCVAPDGTERKACCDYACPEPCPPLRIERCGVTNDGIVTVAWSALSPECCEKIVIRTSAGLELASLLPGDTLFEIPCGVLADRVGSLQGTICVICIGPDGNEVDRACCDYDCRRDGNPQLPGDCNQDGRLDISDGICVLGFLFLGNPTQLPCGDGSAGDPANLALLDWLPEGTPEINLSDAIRLFGFLFLGGPPHQKGTECARLVGCPETCE